MSESHESQGISERESFENGYYYFVQAIDTLSLPADAQLQRMGNCPYNLAWELVYDVRAGEYLLRSPSSSRLSHAQRQAIEALLTELTGVPSELFVGGGRVRNLEVMSHPFWQPLRLRAAHLLRELEPATKECRRFLNMDDELK
jgi:hypothetical protein